MFTNLLRRTPPTKTDEPPLPPVMRVMGFIWDDLHANREGRMSPAQVRMLRLKSQKHTAWILAALLAMPVFSAPFLERVVSVVIGVREAISLTMLVYFVIALAPLLLLLWAMRHQSIFHEDINAAAVEIRTGRVLLEKHRGNHRVILDAERFDISERVYDRFVDRGHYTLYIAPKTRILLGAEEVRG